MSDEVTIEFIKYIEDSPDILKSPNRNRKQQLKEELRIHLGKVSRVVLAKIMRVCKLKAKWHFRYVQHTTLISRVVIFTEGGNPETRRNPSGKGENNT